MKQRLYTLFVIFATGTKDHKTENISCLSTYSEFEIESVTDSKHEKVCTQREWSSVWLICQAALGRGKNKLLVRGVEGAEWVFCPLIKSIKGDRVNTRRCQGCKHFIRFQQTYIPQTRTKRKMLSFGTTTFHIARPSGRLKTTHPRATPFPRIPGLIRERPPLVDVFEEEDHIIVLAELPGVNESDINIKADENTLKISADTPTKKYLKIVRLPTRIKKDMIKYTYKNNVLQVRLQQL